MSSFFTVISPWPGRHHRPAPQKGIKQGAIAFSNCNSSLFLPFTSLRSLEPAPNPVFRFCIFAADIPEP